MLKLTKRRKILLSKINIQKKYSLDKALFLISNQSLCNFLESIDVSINFGINFKKSFNAINGELYYPVNFVKEKKIAVFTSGELAKQSKIFGANFVGQYDLYKYIKSSNLNLDVIISDIDSVYLLKKLSNCLKFKKILPSKKKGTITNNILPLIKSIKSRKVCYKNDKYGIINVSFGKKNFSLQDLKKNFLFFLKSIFSKRNPFYKKEKIKKIVVSTTMGVGIQVDCKKIF